MRMRRKLVFMILAAISATMVLFQNCAPRRFNGGVSSAPLENNGHGYTGKVVYTASSSALCEDKSSLRTRIDLAIDGQYYLVRENCQPRAPEVILPQTLGADNNRPDALIWRGETLTIDPDLSPAVGFFVLTDKTYAGNLGGISGANAACLAELTAQDWAGKVEAASEGLLDANHVRAFLCDGVNCQDAVPNRSYLFARANTTFGGRSFTANELGQGPGDRANWDDAGTFGADLFVWTGRASVSDLAWAGSHAKTCAGWTSARTSDAGRDGSTNFTTVRRWENTDAPCTSLRHLYCFVHPVSP